MDATKLRMRLDHIGSLAVAAAVAALSVGCHALNSDPPPFESPGHGGRESAPATRAEGSNGARGRGGEGATASEAMLGLIAFVREHGWGFEWKHGKENIGGFDEIVVITERSAATADRRDEGGKDGHEGKGGVGAWIAL